jgi:hypothetical protein
MSSNTIFSSLKEGGGGGKRLALHGHVTDDSKEGSEVWSHKSHSSCGLGLQFAQAPGNTVGNRLKGSQR